MHQPIKDASAEKLFSLASSAMDGTWVAKDTPILLHTFEYIVRNALIAWWVHFLVRGSRLRLFLQPLIQMICKKGSPAFHCHSERPKVANLMVKA